MKKRVLAEGTGKYVDGEWQVKNLKFLVEFMRRLHLTTGDLAKAVGLQRTSVTRWFLVDDTNLSKVMTVAEANGCNLYVSYDVPDVPIERTRLIIDRALLRMGAEKIADSRLAFLRIAMQQAGLTNNGLAERLNLTRNSIQIWLKNDDISFRYIYEIAEVMGWTVNIYFKAKEE